MEAATESEIRRGTPLSRLTIRQVEAFRAVMLLGSMTKAAEALQISQPAVSRLMADLQEIIGFPLFRRTRHGTIPTADARRFEIEVTSLFSGLDELTERARAIRNLEIGELRIGTISLYGNGLLPRIIGDFVKLHPGINVTLEIDTHERIVDWLHSRRCEIGLVSLPGSSGELTVHKLAAEPAVCVMPQGHPLAAKPLIQASDLAGVPFISFPRDSATRFQIDNIFDRLGVRREMKIETGTHESVCHFVAAGVGVSIISPFSPHLRGPFALVSRPFQPHLIREIGLLLPDGNLSLPAERCRAFIADYFRNHVSEQMDLAARVAAV
jgi:DNA-binding transcriptional LysR family regulator